MSIGGVVWSRKKIREFSIETNDSEYAIIFFWQRLPYQKKIWFENTRKAVKTKGEADCIKAIILLGTGWTICEVVEALLLDDETITNYLIHYKSAVE